MRLELLKLLARNARYSVDELAVMLNTTSEAVEKEMETLEKEGILREYRAVINWEQLDDAYVSAIVELNVVPKAELGFEEVAEKSRRLSRGGIGLSDVRRL